MRRLTSVLFLIGVVIASLLFSSFLYTSVEAAPKILNVSHQWADGDIRDLWAKKWTELVTKKTEGAIQFRIFPGQSLFKTKAQYDALLKGALHITVYPYIYLSGKLPPFAITSMPCLIKTVKQGANWADHEIGRKLYEIGTKRGGFHGVSWGNLLGGIGSTKKPIILPGDLKGLKTRGAGKPTEEMMHKAGAAITSMPGSEVYFALQTGALDAFMTTYSSFITYRHYEVLEHLTVSKGFSIFSAMHGILVGNKTWDKLSESQRKALTEAGREVQPYITKLSEGISEECVKIYQEKGLKVHFLKEKEFNEWFELSKSTAYKTFAKKVKGGKELLDLALEVKK